MDIAFRLLRLDNAYVCNAGRLVGVITRDSLADFVDQREVSPMDDCVRCGPAARVFFSFCCCGWRGGWVGWWGEGARKRPHLLCELVLTKKWLPLGAFCFCYPCFLGSLFRCRSTLQSSFVTAPPPGAALHPTMSLPSTYKGLQTLSLHGD